MLQGSVGKFLEWNINSLCNKHPNIVQPVFCQAAEHMWKHMYEYISYIYIHRCWMILKHVGIVFCWSKVHVDQQCTEWKAKRYTRWPILLFAGDMLVLGSVYLGNIVLKLKQSAAPSKGYEKKQQIGETWIHYLSIPMKWCTSWAINSAANHLLCGISCVLQDYGRKAQQYCKQDVFVGQTLTCLTK